MYYVIRYFIFIALFLISIIILKKYKILTKKTIIVLLVTTLLLSEVSCLIPVENTFMKFSTIESVYNYMGLKNKNIKHIIDGNKTVFVVNSDKKDSSSTSWYIVLKTDDGYKINVGSDKSSISMTKDFSVSLTTDKRTGDTYIIVTSNKEKPLDLQDNHNSDFVNTNFIPLFGYEYTAFIGNIDENYQLTVNGITYKFEKLTNKAFNTVPIQ